MADTIINDMDDGVQRRRGDGINISRPEMQGAIERYSPDDRELLLWLHGYAMDALRGSRSALVKAIGGEWAEVAAAWHGRAETVTGLVERITRMRRRIDLEESTQFIHTEITDRLEMIFNVARDEHEMVLIHGASGKMKTHTALEWRRKVGHGRAFYVYVPGDGGFRAFLEAMAEAFGISRERSNIDIKRAILNTLSRQDVLIIDEFAHCCPNGKSRSVQAIEMIRELRDKIKCGIIILATDGLPETLSSGHLGKWLEQFLGRICIPYHIPDDFSASEIGDICAAFVKDPETQLVDLAGEIANARKGGIRELLRHLKRSTQVADKRGEKLTFKYSAASWRVSIELTASTRTHKEKAA